MECLHPEYFLALVVENLSVNRGEPKDQTTITLGSLTKTKLSPIVNFKHFLHLEFGTRLDEEISGCNIN